MTGAVAALFALLGPVVRPGGLLGLVRSGSIGLGRIVPGSPSSAGAIATPHIRYLAIMPEIVLLGGAVLLLALASLVHRQVRVKVATGATVAIAGTALGFSLWQWADVASHGAYTAVDHAVAVDGFSVLVNIVLSCATLLTALVGDGYLRREGVEGPELHVLALVSASGAMIMGAANDLIVIFLGLETLSIALYVLAAFNHRRAASGEAALKYFVIGSFSSAVFVYGIALVYGATGSTNLAQIADFLSRNVLVADGLLLAGLALLLVGFFFKVAAVPFHMWTPDVYQGAPSPVTGFMAAVAKVGAFAALLRVFVSSFGVLRADWQPVVYAVAVVTLLLGAGLAVVQRDIKRMLAYSAINHAGFVLLGVEAATARGVSASLYYFFVYTFMVIGSFAVVSLLGRRGDVVHDISSYRGLARRQPALALCFAVLLLAQAGVPFTTGLWAKVEVVLAAIDANALPLGVIAMVSAALAAFFYLRVAVLMYTPVAVGAGSAEVAQQPAEDPVALTAGTVGPYLAPGDEEALAEAGSGPADGAGDGQPGNARPVWAGIERSVAVIDRLNAALLIGAGPTGADGATGGADGATGGADGATGGADGATGPGQAGGEETGVPPSDLTGKVPVPVLTAVAIGLCVAVTVVFGIIPAPLVDFARHATLLFLP